MTFRVEYNRDGKWITHTSMQDLGYAERYAGTLWKQDQTISVRVVSEGTATEGGDKVLYTLNPDFLAVPEGAKGTGIGSPQPVEIPPPLWVDLLPLAIVAIRNGSAGDGEIATEELRKMAKAADLWNASHKAGD